MRLPYARQPTSTSDRRRRGTPSATTSRNTTSCRQKASREESRHLIARNVRLFLDRAGHRRRVATVVPHAMADCRAALRRCSEPLARRPPPARRFSGRDRVLCPLRAQGDRHAGAGRADAEPGRLRALPALPQSHVCWGRDRDPRTGARLRQPGTGRVCRRRVRRLLPVRAWLRGAGAPAAVRSRVRSLLQQRSALDSAHSSVERRVIERLKLPVAESDLHALAELLVDAVDSGAAVSFLSVTPEQALDWWRRHFAATHRGAIFLVARDEKGIVG